RAVGGAGVGAARGSRGGPRTGPDGLAAVASRPPGDGARPPTPRRPRAARRSRRSADGCSVVPRPWDDCTAMARLVLCTLGDVLLDVIVRLEQPLEPGTDAAADTRTGAGGAAANVPAGAAPLG